MLASKLKNHLVVIGYSHLGQRLVSYCQGRGKAYTLIEKDKEKVDELLRNGQPVVVDNACEGDALVDAGVKEARMVIITADNIETSLIVTKKAREMNPDCKILTRCYVDELSEVLESLGADEVVSSSKNVFENIVGKYNL